MRITPITTQNNYQKPNFKSKLPGLNFKYTKGFEDYWGEFGQQCLKKDYGSRLRQALEKLKSNSDDNLLALTRRFTLVKDYKTSEFTFSLHSNTKSKNIDMGKTLNYRNVVIYVLQKAKAVGLNDSMHEIRITGIEPYINFDFQKDSFIEVILKMLESIVEKGTRANDMIFREKVNFVDEYRV